MAGISSFLNRYNLVRQIPIFSKLKWNDVRKIARRIVVVDYKKGDVIRRQEDPPDFLYCLVSGRLQSYTVNHKGQKDNVEFIHRGMYFGIVSLLTGENHSHNYEALNDSVIVQIPKEDFYVILKAIPQMGVEFSQSLSKKVRTTAIGLKTNVENKIISIYSPVQGTGSSTFAVNLALSLAKETTKKTIFVNIISKYYQKQTPEAQNVAAPQWSRSAINLRDLVDDPNRIKSSIIKDHLPIQLLHVAFDPEDASHKRQISPFVSALVGDYNYVVVDLPNDMDDVVLETLTQSDVVHLVSMDREKDLLEIRKVINHLEQNLKEHFIEDRIRVLIRSASEEQPLPYEQIHKILDYNIYNALPRIQASDLKEEVTLKGFSIQRCDPKSEYAKTITRISRQIGGVMVGLVLGGGAALGVAHVGVIRVLEEENIPIDIVVGSSMGALIGSLWASGLNSKELEKVAREFAGKKDLLKLFDPILPIAGLIGGTAIARWLKGHLGTRTFQSNVIPLKVIAYDLIRRDELVIESGSLVEAVRKSIAIPGVVKPVLQKEQVIIDGGVLNPLPTNVLTNMGVRKIIAVNVLQSPEDAAAGYEIMKNKMIEEEHNALLKSPVHFFGMRVNRFLMRFFNPNISDIIVRTLQASEYVIAQQSAELADVVIHPDLVGINWFELYKVEELIQSGAEATRKSLPKIKKLIAE